MTTRWYMLTKDGAATLCIDREDAEANAREADIAWPRNAPHRAVQMVEVRADPAPVAQQKAGQIGASSTACDDQDAPEPRE